MRKCIILSLLCLVPGAVFASTGASEGCVKGLLGEARADGYNFEIGIELDKDPYPVSGQGLRLIARKLMEDVEAPYLENINGAPFNLEAAKIADQKIRCVQAAEVRNVFLCMSYHHEILNGTMWRFSIFSEGFSTVKKRTVVGHDHPAGRYIKAFIGGFNTPGAELTGFFTAVKDSDLSAQERAFKKAVYDRIIERIGGPSEEFYLVSIPMAGPAGTMTFFETASHELLHAQHRMTPSYKRIVTEFWNDEVTSEHKGIFTKSIADIYDTSDLATVIDEFQAYLLQKGSETGVYGAVGKYEGVNFVEKYRTLIVKRLTQAGIKFIELK
ncbi:MAG: hypothetical protein IPK68_14455 [Bdellovibrionales bacterium]|nr:hypothetical protein [Bdellovibrionales bacterium]